MSRSKYVAVTFLLFCLSLHAASCADPLNSICFGQENYNSNGPYAANLNGLLTRLSTTVLPKGFGLGSIGRGRDKVNGLALCRGDVSGANCKACVIEASRELRNRCPDQKGVIIWYDYCLLKYSDVDFFGQIDYDNKFYLVNTQEVDNPAKFNLKVKELLTDLSEKAYANSKFYATGKLRLGRSSTKLYGLAQCTRDLSGRECKKCLDDAISELSNYSDGKEGGRVVGGSCNVPSSMRRPLWFRVSCVSKCMVCYVFPSSSTV